MGLPALLNVGGDAVKDLLAALLPAVILAAADAPGMTVNRQGPRAASRLTHRQARARV